MNTEVDLFVYFSPEVFRTRPHRGSDRCIWSCPDLTNYVQLDIYHTSLRDNLITSSLSLIYYLMHFPAPSLLLNHQRTILTSLHTYIMFPEQI